MFSSSYQEARTKFLDAANRSGYKLEALSMPQNQSLITDIASRIDNNVTKKLLIVNSGIHGIEGYFGSAVQSEWLSKHLAQDLAHELGIIFVHASNPHGFAHSHRVDASYTEGNVVHRVDPNRNFIDFSVPLPENKNYTVLEPALVPLEWTGWSKFATTTKLLWNLLKDKLTGTFDHFSIPALSGQYVSPSGMSFGGTHPSWTNTVFQHVLAQAKRLQNLQEVVFIDLHTGIGANGTLEVYPTLESPIAFSEVDNTLKGIGKVKVVKAPYPVTGALDTYVTEFFKNLKVTAMTIEAGTESALSVFNALRGQNWQDVYGVHERDKTTSIVRDAFYPEHDQAWKESVTQCTNHVLERVIDKMLKSAIYAPQRFFQQPIMSGEQAQMEHHVTMRATS